MCTCVVIVSVFGVDVVEIDTDLYRGFKLLRLPPMKFIYGGQLIAQALEAATRTVASNLMVHSLHAYFVRGGDWNLPVTYRVLRVDDGQSFSKRSVLASQRGQPITIILVSFHKQEPSSFEHQPQMPAVPDPETLKDHFSFFNRAVHGKSTGELLEDDSETITGEITLRFVGRQCPVSQEWKEDARACFWLKMIEPISSNEQSLHSCLVSYMSDYNMLGTALLRHPEFEYGIMASLDYSIWFYSPVRADQWLLFELHSPRAAHNRVLTTGRLYKQDGTLAVSIVQEGLIRPKL